MAPQLPQLLIDTDAFCKLAVADLLDEVLALLGVNRAQCAVLPALPHMLERGQLRERYGEVEADRLRELAGTFPIAPASSSTWMDELTTEPNIDPGEAQLFALAAEHGMRILTSDKRALVAIAKMSGILSRLSNSVVTLEAVLMGLTTILPDAQLRPKGRVLGRYDQMAKAVFNSIGSDLDAALNSYLRDLESRVAPIDLWRHRA